MITQIVGDIVLNIPYRVVNGVVVGEKFFTKRDIVLIIFQNIDEREYAGVGAAGIVQFRECALRCLQRLSLPDLATRP